MIRTKLTVWNGVVLSMVLAALALVLYFTVRTIRYQAVDDDLRARASLLHQIWRDVEKHAPPKPPPDRNLLFDFGDDPNMAKHLALEARMSHPMLLSILGRDLVDPKGHVWDMHGLISAAKGIQCFTTIQDSGIRARIFSVPIVSKSRVVAVAQLATPLDTIDEDVHFLGQALLLMIPLAIVVTTFTGMWLTKRMLKPIRDIAQAAERIEYSNLNGRLPVNGQDEFAELATTFNGMLGRLDASFQKLGAAYEAQRRFTADASHELKTPLTAIKARVGIALHGDSSPARVRDHIEAIDTAADQMTHIVRDLLLLAVSDDGRLNLRLRRVSLLAIVLDAIELVKPLEGRQIDLRISPRLTTWADQDLLRRVIVNLLDNAARHTPDSGTIGVEAKRVGHQVSIHVYDTGDGIPEENLPFVFERLYRVDSSRNRDSGGTGLGLAIVKSIVEAHRGMVEIASHIGTGTSVTITLPRKVIRTT